MLTTPFLTDLDSRAAVKGSRDPLGIQPIWTRLGRHVVGNLTTVSSSVRDFTTLMLGYYFAERIADEIGPGTELSTFLKWEQLAAYSRAAVNNDFQFRGTERVRKHLAESSRITLSADRSHQILGNQKIYGLWGLYTMPARSSGLVAGDPPRLTPPALELVQNYYLPLLGEEGSRDAKKIRSLLRQKLARLDVERTDADLIQAIGKVLKRSLRTQEREFFRFHLLHGGPQDDTHGRQQQLAELVAESLHQKNFSLSPAVVRQWVKAAHTRGEAWEPLAHRLHRIGASESLLAPTSALFTYLLGLDGKSLSSVADRIHREWESGLPSISLEDIRDLEAELATEDLAGSARWVKIAEAMAGGDWKALILLLVEQNRSVMGTRGGAPWLEVRDGKLQVRFRDEQGALPKRAEVSGLWRFPYFLDSLRSVAETLKEKGDG